MAPPTTRLYLEDARRKTALAQITGHYAGGFQLDRSLYHAAHPSYHHKQPSDRGHLLADGHKVKINKVGWNRDALTHRTSAEQLPPIGAKAQLHLDADRRDLQARAHTVMHLLISAVTAERGELLTMPEVVGGGHVNAHAKFREAPQLALAKVLKRVQVVIAARVDVRAEWAARDDAAKRVTHHPVALDAVAPGEPTLRLVSIGDACTLPCDAPLIANTRDITSVTMGAPRVSHEGVRWQWKVK